jgi:hypothetical protein
MWHDDSQLTNLAKLQHSAQCAIKSAATLSVIMPNAVLMRVVAPLVMPEKCCL